MYTFSHHYDGFTVTYACGTQAVSFLCTHEYIHRENIMIYIAYTIRGRSSSRLSVKADSKLVLVGQKEVSLQQTSR